MPVMRKEVTTGRRFDFVLDSTKNCIKAILVYSWRGAALIKYIENRIMLLLHEK